MHLAASAGTPTLGLFGPTPGAGIRTGRIAGWRRRVTDRRDAGPHGRGRALRRPPASSASRRP
ncbi:MAG: hypothetical protein WDN25_07820 [Acetobacteraceae bacterium]